MLEVKLLCHFIYIYIDMGSVQVTPDIILSNVTPPNNLF